MADPNKAAIASAIRLVEARGLHYSHVQWIGSNFMSNGLELEQKRLFAVRAYRFLDNGTGQRVDKVWFTFTYKARARMLRNETQHPDERAAELHFDEMVDTGEVYHPNNMDVWWADQATRDMSRRAKAKATLRKESMK